MNGKRSTIVYLHQRAPDAALASLNRLTGLCFTQWPESLVQRAGTPDTQQPIEDEPLPKVKGMKS